jgi:lysophospholipid acyltransferase (LPLAT)-like uncharacterized protein
VSRDEGRSGLKYALAGYAGALLLRLIRATWRVTEEPHRFVAARRRAPGAGRAGTIYLIWHSRILLSAATQADHGVHVLISRHGDGEFIARAVLRLGFETVRGSSTRGGARALVEIVRVLREGGDVAITPDGPKGPRGRVQAGCVIAAARSGAEIVAVAIECSRKRRLRSWDRFVVPLPFCRVAVRFGEPISSSADMPMPVSTISNAT